MKTALVFSGGSSKGAHQVGMVKALLEKENDLDIIGLYGTSVGALNSAGLSYVGIEGLEKVWLDLRKNSDILRFKWLTLGPVFGSAIYNTKPLRKILDNILGSNSPKYPVCVTKVNIETGELVYGKSSDDDFINSVHASTAVPFAMEPIDNIWVDGGVRDQTPLKKAIDDGAERIIVFLANPWRTNPEFEKRPGGLLKGFRIGMRAIDIVSHEIFVSDVNNCLSKNDDSRYKKIVLEVYAPKELKIGSEEFDPVKIRAAMKHGYESYLMGPVIK